MMDLQSHQRWVSPIFQYLLYGAGVSEVKYYQTLQNVRIYGFTAVHSYTTSFQQAQTVCHV